MTLLDKECAQRDALIGWGTAYPPAPSCQAPKPRSKPGTIHEAKSNASGAGAHTEQRTEQCTEDKLERTPDGSGDARAAGVRIESLVIHSNPRRPFAPATVITSSARASSRAMTVTGRSVRPGINTVPSPPDWRRTVSPGPQQASPSSGRAAEAALGVGAGNRTWR